MSKRTTGLGFWCVSLALAIPAGVAGQNPPTPRQQVEPYEVGHALPPVDAGATILNMTLDGAIQRALENNLDIQSARLNPEIQEYSLNAARAAFSPTLSMTYGYDNSTNRSTSQLEGGASTATETYTANSSLSKTMPWWGGRLSATFNNNRVSTNNPFQLFNPSYKSTLRMNYTQPLLAGRSTDNQRAALETQEIQADITDLQVQTQVANITNQVRLAYWGLRSAIEQIEIQRLNLAQARQLLNEDSIRVRLGRMTDLQLVQAQAQVASAEQSLLNAEIQWRNQEFAFKRLLLSGPNDPLLTQTVNPVDQPVIVDQSVDIQAAIDLALRQRTDIRQQRQQRDITTVNLAATRSSALPELTLTGSYSLLGVAGSQYMRDDLGGAPQLVQATSYLDGLRSIADRETPTWSLTLNASYPLGANSSKASLQRARLQLRQADLALRSQELAIITQVTTAGLAVRNSYLQYQAAQRNREAAERNAETELLRYGVGVATNFEVVQAQNSLTTARLSELNAIINHTNAITEFERVQRVGN